MDFINPQFVASVLTILVAFGVIMGSVAYLVLLERKISAWIQDRVGPNRVGPFGLFQPIADGIKLFLKEDYSPPNADRVLFTLAPILAVIPAIIVWAVIPWGGWWEYHFTIWQWVPFIGGTTFGPGLVSITAAQLNIGVIYILAVGSLAVYGVVLAGYSSNNKYSFLGGLRATAQMLSYEIPLSLCVLVVILMWGTFRADTIVHLQANSVWNIFYHPLLGLLFFIALLAEANRAPFDLIEAEQELVGGFHTEYSSMRFALFFLTEYMHLITASAFFVLMFLGGWDLPLIEMPLVAAGTAGFGWVILKFAVFAAKIAIIISLVMVIRWTLPRLRFDQLMRLAWRNVIPVCLVLMLATGLIVLLRPEHWDPATWYWLLLPVNIVVGIVFMLLGRGSSGSAQGNRRLPMRGSRFSPLAES